MLRRIEFRVPSETIQCGDVLFGVLVGVDERGDDVDRPGAPTGLDDVVPNLTQHQLFGDLRVRFLIHPLRTLRSCPHDEVIVLAQSLAAAKVRVAQVMLAGARVRPLCEQQRDHHEGAVVAVHHRDVASGQAPEHRTQQGRLPGFFALVRPDRQVHYASGGQRNDRHGPRDRQTDARLLRFRLRVRGLVLRRVGHGEREAVDQFGMLLAFP